MSVEYDPKRIVALAAEVGRLWRTRPRQTSGKIRRENRLKAAEAVLIETARNFAHGDPGDQKHLDNLKSRGFEILDGGRVLFRCEENHDHGKREGHQCQECMVIMCLGCTIPHRRWCKLERKRS